METKENCCEKRSCRCSFWRCTGYGLLGVFGFAIFALIFGVVIMGLWNWIMPPLFKFGLITFWQAVGLAILARLLFGASHMGWHHRWGGRMWKRSHCNCGCQDDCHCNCHTHTHNNKNNECRCNSTMWQYYDKFWEEEGEKAFHDYVQRKSENPDNGAKT